ncbi:hypothetical protein [Paenibacillus nuruki]|uniref:hypothetical protein n=1 Tax=Paenibacillus nuruki TaxID=1886670 RepID=UPI002804667C|nr:hypothetical protein [Paenibacillus nuruki]CAJ1315721.1 hypothetical protein AASFL403_10895 [Paenibacillus nuruki]
MKIFKISQESNIIHELTVTNFENLTHKREPYFIKEEKMKYYAVCPSCNNPIQIINLYPQKKLEMKSLNHYMQNITVKILKI